jgi:hypothetical protein
MKKTLNGGIELGIFEIVGKENLSRQDVERMEYLQSLPKNTWISLDRNGVAISDEEAQKIEDAELARYGVKAMGNEHTPRIKRRYVSQKELALQLSYQFNPWDGKTENQPKSRQFQPWDGKSEAAWMEEPRDGKQ